MDAAWKVIGEMGCDWCEHQCANREGCGCADMVQKGIDTAVSAEREACIAALGDLAKMAKIVGDVSATRALLSAADALSARNQ